MAYHIAVTIDPLTEEGRSVEQIAEAMLQLKPASITVDLGAPLGRVLLASLQAKGLPATAFEKRPRPTLPEVAHADQLSQACKELQQVIDDQRKELKHLREYQHDVRVLIQRLE